MKFIVRVFLFLALLLPGSLAQAAELGTAIFNGKRVILSDDGTWKYANPETAAANGDCTPVSSELVPFSICLNSSDWTNANLGGGHEHSIKHKKHELYLLVISESVFIKMPALKSALLENAKSAAGLNKVNVFEEENTQIDGHPAGRIVYQTKISGIDITYENFYTNFKDTGSLQLVFFAAKSQFESLRPLIRDAMSTVKLNR